MNIRDLAVGGPASARDLHVVGNFVVSLTSLQVGFAQTFNAADLASMNSNISTPNTSTGDVSINRVAANQTAVAYGGELRNGMLDGISVGPNQTAAFIQTGGQLLVLNDNDDGTTSQSMGDVAFLENGEVLTVFTCRGDVTALPSEHDGMADGEADVCATRSNVNGALIKAARWQNPTSELPTYVLPVPGGMVVGGLNFLNLSIPPLSLTSATRSPFLLRIDLP